MIDQRDRRLVERAFQSMTSHKRGWITRIGLVLMLLLPGACARSEPLPESEPPARVEAIEGSKLARVILTPRAVERLGIETTAIDAEDKSLIVPYSTLLYDTHGDTWIFIVAGENTFIRAPIKVDRIDGDRVFLLEGPAAGTEVVTVGVAELYGTETGVGQ